MERRRRRGGDRVERRREVAEGNGEMRVCVRRSGVCAYELGGGGGVGPA